ncbi:FCD domain-containing protein [Sphingobium sufflavum]|uniref:FadR/GntR family transcriptional regulator n=1 Tax=Sphingobium sufflavum TaxID=1129547 RepID=UPI001F41CB4C|nr:FCD domain-containing protein [Sphingobium sufflavum]MCE7798053.1 FCD domain-containing protein [Sphingobium sufflavum]
MAGKASKDGLVALAAARMKDIILTHEPGAPLGSLPDIAKAMNVGVATVRQAARLLEHEGFLKVRRGNGGGFFAARPDAMAVGRAVAGFLDVARSHEREAIEIMTLLDCDLMAAAAQASDEGLRARLREHAEQIDACDRPEQRAAFVQEMHNIIFRMVDRPLMEMMARMSMEHYTTRTGFPIYDGTEGAARWKQERHAIIYAILRRDPDLARFEAQRRRDYVLRSMADAGSVS